MSDRLSFEAAHGLLRGLPGRRLPVVVGASFGRVAQLDGGHDVQDAVDLPVAGPGQPVADVVAGGRVDRGGSVPGREVGAVGEPGDVADLDQQPGRTGRSDAVQVQQAGPGGRDQVDEFLVGGLLAGIDPLQVGDELGGDAFAGLAGGVPGRTGRAAPWPGPRTGPSSPRPGSAPAAAHGAGRPSGCGPHPATRRRSTSSRSTASCSSSTTGRSPAIRVPTSATECASVASVLRP